ncbi:hypothetical protein SAMN05444746_112142 [Variovorax sp. OK212]|nr:hypothetical protein SAMN05518853_11240 [Variovorax sp. OK202]SFD87690.1 hypothetical protein SAMN05444746_112142 [Variovorax sp. OK212]
MTTCAYCGCEGTMTREHVIPSFIYDFQKKLGSKVLGWNEVSQKMIAGEAKVRDVCATCNNKVLGDLDSYGKETLESSGILVADYKKRDLELTYDFDQLARWLLKISFNSSRTDGAHSSLFSKYIPYMLGKGIRPKSSEVAIVSYLAAPSPLEVDGEKLSNPFIMRISYGQPNEVYMLRIVSFGPLFFFLQLFEQDVLAGHAASATRRLIKDQCGSVELLPTRKWMRLQSGTASWADLYTAQVSRVRDLNRRVWPD